MFGRRDRRIVTDAARAGAAALDRGDLDEAERVLRAAVEASPGDRSSWYNLALVHKFRRAWPEALAAGLRAAPVDGTGRSDPVWWNLGLSATAVEDWATARRAWRNFGIRLPDGEGEIEADLGITPVRINPDDAAEVVWGQRLDPARARLISVPTPDSGRRWGDIVLHDGEPRGERRVGSRRLPVFDELERWRACAVPTLSVRLTAAEADVDALVTAVEQAGGGAEDWTAIRLLCPECSLGTPGHHEHEANDWQPERHVGLAVPRATAKQILTEWREAAPASRAWSDLTEVG